MYLVLPCGWRIQSHEVITELCQCWFRITVPRRRIFLARIISDMLGMFPNIFLTCLFVILSSLTLIMGMRRMEQMLRCWNTISFYFIMPVIIHVSAPNRRTVTLHARYICILVCSSTSPLYQKKQRTPMIWVAFAILCSISRCLSLQSEGGSQDIQTLCLPK